jgi:hypothetical protein
MGRRLSGTPAPRQHRSRGPSSGRTVCVPVMSPAPQPVFPDDSFDRLG